MLAATLENAAVPAKEYADEYKLKLSDFIGTVCPEFEFPEQLSYLKDQTVSSLNVLLKFIKELYDVGKAHVIDIGSAIVHALNFYIGTKNSSNWAEVSVGFTSLCLSLFKLEGIANAAKHVQFVVSRFFNDLKTYFVTSESAEKQVKGFWNNLSISDPRTLFGMVHSFSGVFTSVICIKTFVTKAYTDGNIISLVTTVSNGIMKVGSDLRQHAMNVTIFLSRVYDWIHINAEFLYKMQWDKVRWELPQDQIFESKFADLTNIINKYVEDPMSLEANNMTLATLREKIMKLREEGDKELNKNPVPSIRSAILRYITQMDAYLRMVEEKLSPDNTKPQPLVVTLVGSAGCGKSSASTKIGLMMQAIVGRVPNPSVIRNRGGDPKFEENIYNSTDVIIWDDYANDRSQKMSTKSLLDIVNTCKETIPKASVDEKGLHKYSNIGTIITTNDENLGMDLYKTASADSLLRRLGYVVELRIKDEYCLPGTTRLDMNHPAVDQEAFNTDVYDVRIRKPVGLHPMSKMEREVNYVDIPFDRNNGNNEWRDAVIKLQELLEDEWTKNLDRQERANSKENFCKKCELPMDMCVCSLKNKEKPLPSQSGVESIEEPVCPPCQPLPLQSGVESAEVPESPPCQPVPFPTDMEDWGLDDSGSLEIRAEALSISRARVSQIFFRQPAARAEEILAYMDSSVIDFSSSLAIKVSLYIFYLSVARYLRSRYPVYVSVKFASLLVVLVTILPAHFVIFVPLLIIAWESYFLWKLRVNMDERNLACGRFIAESRRMRYAAYGAGIATSALVLFSLFTFTIATSHNICSEDASEVKPEPEEVVVFTAPREKTSSDSLGYFLTKPRPAHQARTMTESQVVADIGRGIVPIEIVDETGVTSYVKGLPFGSQRLIPGHALSDTELHDINLLPNGVIAGYKNIGVPKTHHQVLTKSTTFLTQKKLDASLVHLPNVPPGKDFSRYLSAEGSLPEQAGCTYLHKESDGSVKEIGVRARLLPNPITYGVKGGKTVQYVYECTAQSHKSSDGDCGQPLIYNNSIIGIHIAGTGTNVWYCLAIDRSCVERAEKILKSESSIFVSSTPPEPVFKNNLKNLSIIDNPNSYVLDQLNTTVSPIISLGAVVDAAGSLYRPRAEDYYFRNTNEQIDVEFGVASSRPPKYVNGVTQINTTLEKFNTPKTEVPLYQLDRAAEDYVRGEFVDSSGQIETLSSYANKLEQESPGFFSVRPIETALDGDGSGIIRGMNNNTSSGVCYGGKKVNYLAKDEEGLPLIPRQLDPIIEEDILKLEHEWRSGRGTCDPFVRASKTNEVLPLKKAYEKTRSVYGNDVSFFVSSMRGGAALKHVLRNSKISECYVGITAQSKEWSNLYDFLTNDGKFTKFVCGDFSGYDTQLPKSLMDKAAAIMIQMYRENGASNSDIEYLRGMLSSIVSPTMIWEGHLLQLCSGQPSGQPFTVDMNSIINSLLVRVAFFVIMDEEYPEIKNPNFRDYVHLATYGDDNAMGVSDKIPKFNHTSIQAVFARWGIKYTMADKDADSVPYQTIEEVSFLKRSFVYHFELDSIVAPIETESLTKKFYWWTKSKNTPLTFPEQFQANFESQSREAYLHGEEFYNDFCAKCERIVTASHSGDERFILPWNTIQPISAEKMRNKLVGAYHDESSE